MSDLSKRFDEAAISLASRGQLNRHLEPRLWESLRLRLQAVYRKATGEAMAVLSADHNPASRISQQDAELERLRREVEEARAEHQFSLGLVDQAAVKLAETKDALQDIYKAIEREPIVGDLDYPHAHNDWRGWHKKVLRPAAEKARALLGGE